MKQRTFEQNYQSLWDKLEAWLNQLDQTSKGDQTTSRVPVCNLHLNVLVNSEIHQNVWVKVTNLDPRGANVEEFRCNFVFRAHQKDGAPLPGCLL